MIFYYSLFSIGPKENECSNLLTPSNPRTEGSRLNLPLCNEETSSSKQDLGSRANFGTMTSSLFPSPLTCSSIEDMAFMDEDSQNMVSVENEPDYEEIGWLLFTLFVISLLNNDAIKQYKEF